MIVDEIYDVNFQFYDWFNCSEMRICRLSIFVWQLKSIGEKSVNVN